MSKDHRFFHRRMAQAATQVVTVEIVATVDTSGNLVAQETLTPQFPPEPTAAAVVANAPAIPSIIAPFVSPLAPALPVTPVPQAAVSDIRVPAVPQAITSALQNLSPAPALATVLAVPAALPSLELLSIPQVPAAPTVATPVLPVVPSVPPFPSDLRVPSVPPFPFSTGGVVAQTAAATTSAATSDAPVNVAALAISSSLSAPAISESISAVSSNAASIPSASLIVSALGSPGPTSSYDTQSSVLYSGKASETRSAFLTSSTTQSDAAVSTYFGGGGGSGVPGGAAAPTSGFGTSASEQQNGPTTPLETPQVVGSVVGSLAGAALILAIVLLLLRRHKRRRGGALQLSDTDHVDNDRSMRQAPPRPARASVIPAAFLNRFSGMSRSTTETNLSGGERSFQRVSGRKLPSVFSEGMTSDQFSRGGTMSESSFYQDDHGIYGGAALDKEFGKEIGDSPRNRESGHMNFRPGPARTPMIRNLDDPFSDAYRSHLSPPQSPNSNIHPRGTLGRSLPSADGSRSSRFTENV